MLFNDIAIANACTSKEVVLFLMLPNFAKTKRKSP